MTTHGESLIQGFNGVRSFNSFLNINKIFTNTFFDDFSLSSYLSNPSTVVSLGSSLGSSIRVLSSLKNVSEAYFVDPEASVHNQAKDLISKYCSYSFNQIFITSTALEFLEQYQGTADLIHVDIFSKNGHAEDFFKSIFYENLRKVSAENGVIHFNLYSYPVYLYDQDSIPSLIVQEIKENFRHLALIKHRRNISVIASNSKLIFRDSSFNIENNIDAAIADFNKKRARFIEINQSCFSLVENLSNNDGSFNQINSLFKEKYLNYCSPSTFQPIVELIKLDNVNFNEKYYQYLIHELLNLATAESCETFELNKIDLLFNLVLSKINKFTNVQKFEIASFFMGVILNSSNLNMQINEKAIEQIEEVSKWIS